MDGIVLSEVSSRVIHSYSVFTSTNHVFLIVIPVLYDSIVEVLPVMVIPFLPFHLNKR